MKTITGLADPVKSFTGENMRADSEGETFKHVEGMLTVLSRAKRTGKDEFVLITVGQKLAALNGDNSIDLEDHELDILKEEVEKFEGYPSLIRGQLRQCLEVKTE